MFLLSLAAIRWSQSVKISWMESWCRSHKSFFFYFAIGSVSVVWKFLMLALLAIKENILARNPRWRAQGSAQLTSLYKLVYSSTFDIANTYSSFIKQATSMRRSTVLSPSPSVSVPWFWLYFRHLWREMEKKAVLRLKPGRSFWAVPSSSSTTRRSAPGSTPTPTWTPERRRDSF